MKLTMFDHFILLKSSLSNFRGGSNIIPVILTFKI